MNLGLSHDVDFPIPSDVTVSAPKPTQIIIEGIDLVLQEIINTVALDNRVEIRGFGSFSKKTIRPRRFINPKTKEESYLGETSIMHFKASKKLLKIND